MKKGAGKALYIFLCSILGLILFMIFHRALVVIYYLVLDNNFQKFSFGMTAGDIQILDFLTMLVALFLGGWYGVWLGLHWYNLVYEGEHQPGLFHGFIPHHWRKSERARRSAERAPVLTTKPVHVPVAGSDKAFEKLASMKTNLPWDLDDLGDSDVKLVRKPVRKRVARKSAKQEGNS